MFKLVLFFLMLGSSILPSLSYSFVDNKTYSDYVFYTENIFRVNVVDANCKKTSNVKKWGMEAFCSSDLIVRKVYKGDSKFLGKIVKIKGMYTLCQACNLSEEKYFTINADLIVYSGPLFNNSLTIVYDRQGHYDYASLAKLSEENQLIDLLKKQAAPDFKPSESPLAFQGRLNREIEYALYNAPFVVAAKVVGGFFSSFGDKDSKLSLEIKEVLKGDKRFEGLVFKALEKAKGVHPDKYRYYKEGEMMLVAFSKDAKNLKFNSINNETEILYGDVLEGGVEFQDIRWLLSQMKKTYYPVPSKPEVFLPR